MCVSARTLAVLSILATACGGSSDGGNDPTFPTEHPRIYLGKNKERLVAALTAGDPAATRFRDMVDAWMGGRDIWGFSAWNAALMTQLTGDAKYCAKAIDVVDGIVKAAEADISAGTAPEVAGDSYLGIGATIGDLALVYDWCTDSISGEMRTRWLAFANQAVWNVWHPMEAKWGGKTMTWNGWSIDNPSNNYYYSFLRATMLLGLATKGEEAQADEWITTFHDAKIMGELVPTFDMDLVGGGSREGTGYGVAMNSLFLLYDWWEQTTGEQISTKTQHTRASAFAFMHQVVPTLDKIAPTGDHSRDSTAAFFDYHRAYLLELIALFPKETFAGRARALLDGSNVKQMDNQFMYVNDLLANPTVESQPLSGLNTAYYASGIGEVYARSSWDKDATWVNMIAGPYTETHAHQDQGSLMIYKGTWLAYDANIQAHSGLSQPTTSHSLVRIDDAGKPIAQSLGSSSTMMALHQGNGYVYAAADVTPVYKGNAAIQKVHREMIYVQPDVVIVYDRVASGGSTSQVWQLQSPVAASINGAKATITSAGHTLTVDKVLGGTLSVHDMKDEDIMGGFRLDETMSGGDNRYLHVLSVDGAVTSVAAMGASGVTVNLASGKTITATFVADSVGATLNLGGSNITLGAGIDSLPE